MRRRFKFLLIILIALFIVTLLYLQEVFTRGSRFIVTNNSSDVIKSIEIVSKGDSKYLPELKPQKSYTTYINPTSESSVELKWIDSDGKNYSNTAVGYIEGGYTDIIQVTFISQDMISVSHEIDGQLWFLK